MSFQFGLDHQRRESAVAPNHPPRLQEEIPPSHLVGELVKAPVRFFLRFRM